MGQKQKPVSHRACRQPASYPIKDDYPELIVDSVRLSGHRARGIRLRAPAALLKLELL